MEYRSENAVVVRSRRTFRSFGGSKSMAITLIVQFLVSLPPPVGVLASPAPREQWVTNQRRWSLNLARSHSHGYVSPNDAWKKVNVSVPGHRVFSFLPVFVFRLVREKDFRINGSTAVPSYYFLCSQKRRNGNRDHRQLFFFHRI